MQSVKYIKSFSRGQITIPKEVRDTLGIGEDFWLKLFVDKGKIIAEPVDERKMNHDEFLHTLLNMKETWDMREEIKQNRKQIEDRLKKNAL